jgi:hypothetical protein
VGQDFHKFGRFHLICFPYPPIISIFFGQCRWSKPLMFCSAKPIRGQQRCGGPRTNHKPCKKNDHESPLCQIRRPRPWPRQGRRLGPPQVWNFSFLAFQGRLPALKSHRLNIPLACFILQPTGTPRPHINGFLWASKPAVCQP